MSSARTPSDKPESRAPRANAVRQIILERRGRFVRMALAGAGLALAGSGCDGCEPTVCLEAPATDAGARSPKTDGGIPPGACLSIERVPDEPSGKATADPQVCLEAPVRPSVCLSPMPKREKTPGDPAGTP